MEKYIDKEISELKNQIKYLEKQGDLFYTSQISFKQFEIKRLLQYKEDQQILDLKEEREKIDFTKYKYRIKAILNYEPVIWLNHLQDRVFKFIPKKYLTSEMIEKEEDYANGF